MSTPSPESLPILLKGLKLPSFVSHHQEVAAKAEKGGWTFTDYLRNLAELELAERHRRKIERLHASSKLPEGKTLATLKEERVPATVKRQLPSLCRGEFVKRAENILLFGLPGRGKTHVACAIGHELVSRGFRVLFIPAFLLVQQLLAAKRDLELERKLRQLDRVDVVLIDDIGYVQQSQEEMEVLFTFLSERYERRSVVITSNLVFSKWDQIFKNPLTTAAAIDRIVHHSHILEFAGPSIRWTEAEERLSQVNEGE